MTAPTIDASTAGPELIESMATNIWLEFLADNNILWSTINESSMNSAAFIDRNTKINEFIDKSIDITSTGNSKAKVQALLQTIM